ncbi:MAG: hypothetical protein VB032_02825 [Burkholderiaceae bacterium]|nr:hypothetical protein [Burkholderiaceae bacterium]
MKKLFAVCIFLLALSQTALATPQRTEMLQHDGKTSSLLALPLGPLLTQDPEIAEAMRKHTSGPRCSAAMRGYRGTWAIRGERLFLIRLVSNPCGPGVPIPLSDIFPRKKGAVFAEWYNGTLVVPHGRQDNNVKVPGYMRTPLTGYRKKLVYTVKNGRVIKREIVDIAPPRPLSAPSAPAGGAAPK